MPTLTAATSCLMGHALISPASISFLQASAAATLAPVMLAVRVPPSAASTSQSIHIVRCPSFSKSIAARIERPISRWISDERPSIFPLLMSRCLR